MKMKLVSLSDWGNHNAFTNKEHQYQTMWVKPGFTVTVDYRPPPNPEVNPWGGWATVKIGEDVIFNGPAGEGHNHDGDGTFVFTGREICEEYGLKCKYCRWPTFHCGRPK